MHCCVKGRAQRLDLGLVFAPPVECPSTPVHTIECFLGHPGFVRVRIRVRVRRSRRVRVRVRVEIGV